MQIKEGASLNGLRPEMRPVLQAANHIWAELKRQGNLAEDKELTITCGTDGEHSAGSLHYYGYALDLRNRDFEDKGERASKVLRQVLNQFQSARQLKGAYGVKLEPTHIHVQFKPTWMAQEQAQMEKYLMKARI